jgi:hypothetical protein
MRCHRPGEVPGEDARVQKAARAAARDETLKKKLAAQIALDERCARLVNSIALPLALVEKLAALPEPEETHRFHWRAGLKQPPILAACIAFAVMIGWGIYFAVNHFDEFPGKEKVEQMVALNDEMSGMEMEIKSAPVGNLEDWLFSRYKFESFYVPPQFVGYKTVGCRVFKQVNGLPVAQLAIEEHNMLFYMFSAKDFGVKIAPADQWKLFKEEDWVAAIQQHEGSCFMVAFRGSKQQMREFLAAAR